MVRSTRARDCLLMNTCFVKKNVKTKVKGKQQTASTWTFFNNCQIFVGRSIKFLHSIPTKSNVNVLSLELYLYYYKRSMTSISIT